jgi:hypothetical protein
MTNYQFDQVARSERHFTSALLPHILMSENFQRLKFLFDYLSIKPDEKSNLRDFEVVAELDPLRDGSVYNDSIRDLFKEFKRVAVPDLFLRWGNSILIIEAKFFTDPDFNSIIDQVKLQIEAIEKVRNQTIYNKDFTISYLVLTIKQQNQEKIDKSPINAFFKTWDNILALFENHLNPLSDDLNYTIKQLSSSVMRAKDEFSGKKKTNIKFDKIPTFNELMQRLPKLISENKIYVGFSGGLQKLENTSIENFEKRDHYKVSDFPWSANWIRLDLILKQYFNKKYNNQEVIETNDEDEIG